MEVVLALGIGVPRRLRRLAAAAAAHLPGDHRAVAAVLRGQPVHLQHGPAGSTARRARSPACTTDARRIADPCRRRWC